MERECSCGDGQAYYHPMENQWEPGCWYCYHHPVDDHDYSESVSEDEDEDELPF